MKHDQYIVGKRHGKPSERIGKVLWQGKLYTIDDIVNMKGPSRGSIRYAFDNWAPTVSIDEIMRLPWEEAKKLYQSRKGGASVTPAVEPEVDLATAERVFFRGRRA